MLIDGTDNLISHISALFKSNQIKKFYLKSVHFITINISSQELFNNLLNFFIVLFIQTSLFDTQLDRG